MQSHLLFKRLDGGEDIKIIIEYSNGESNAYEQGLNLLHSTLIEGVDLKYRMEDQKYYGSYRAHYRGLSKEIVYSYLEQYVKLIDNPIHKNDRIELILKTLNSHIPNK
jgi:hypothetical protein